MSTLLLVRHGESRWNHARLLQGQADAPLTERGCQQVLALRALVAGFGCDHVVSSDLGRARETTRLLGWERPELDLRWREADLGAWTGCDSRALAAANGHYQMWRDGLYTPPGGESFTELGERVAGALRDLPPGGTTLVVTHGGAIRAALDRLIGLGPGRVVPAAPASLTVVDIGGDARLRAYNLTGAVAPAVDPPD